MQRKRDDSEDEMGVDTLESPLKKMKIAYNEPPCKDVLVSIFYTLNLLDLFHARAVCKSFNQAFMEHKESLIHNGYCITYEMPKLACDELISWLSIAQNRAQKEHKMRPNPVKISSMLLEPEDNSSPERLDIVLEGVKTLKMLADFKRTMTERNIPRWMILGTYFSLKSTFETTTCNYDSNDDYQTQWTLYTPSGAIVKFKFECYYSVSKHEQEVNGKLTFQLKGQKSVSLLQMSDHGQDKDDNVVDNC